MVDRNIVNKLGVSEQEIDRQVGEMFGEKENELLEEVLRAKVDSHLPGTILKGKIVSQIGNDVIVEVGLKSEGVVEASEFDDPEEIVPGKEIEVLLEETDSESGLILLSKHKADRIRGWENIINTKKEGDVVTGKVIRRIKGGLLVDIGVPVFLPASQVDIRRPGDISRFIGKQVECVILKIDVEGRNIVISRRKLIEDERRVSKEKILSEIEVGQRRKGVVKNIADFGVFVDLGGLDGLLHISDLSWGRISHPSEVVKLDEEIECVVIGVDKENEKISLGLKQKTQSPWVDVEQRYPVGAKVKGKIVNIMNYGVFVRLEDGIEGLVHISEMSWTKRLNHPSEMVGLGDEVEVIVLNVNREKQEISLGLKQTQTNPWSIASQKYPPGTIVTTIARGVTNYGVFVEIEEGIDGMIHISDLSWTRKYSHPNEAVRKGEQIKCVVLDIDPEKQRVSLGVKQLTEDPWARAIPEKYIPGHIIKGKVTKLTNFGAFVELEPDLEGLLHISELADHKIKKPQDVVKVGDELEVKLLKVDTESRKIGLSLRRAQWAAEDQAAEGKTQKKTTPVAVQTVISDSQAEKLVAAGKPAEQTPTTEPKEQPADAVHAEADQPQQAEEIPTDEPAADTTDETAEQTPDAEPETQAEEAPTDEPAADTTDETAEQIPDAEPKTQAEEAPTEEPAADTADETAEQTPDAEPKTQAEPDTDSPDKQQIDTDNK